MFFWLITVVAVTAVLMSLIRSGLFLLLVALFSFYLAFTGYRVLSRKTPQQCPSKADWTAASTMLLGGLALVAAGVYLMTASSFVRDVGHARFSSSPGGQNGVVVHPHDENAGRLQIGEILISFLFTSYCSDLQ